MNKEEFVQKFNIYYFNKVYYLTYREKATTEYEKELENNEPLDISEEGLAYFKEELKDIPDKSNIYLFYVGDMYKTNQVIYSVTIYDEAGVKISKLFPYDFHNDRIIDILINTLCESARLNNKKEVMVKFIVGMNENEFAKYYDDFMEEVK